MAPSENPSKPLSDTRRSVLERVKLNQPTTIEELAAAMGLSYETARHHLSQFESAGWVTKSLHHDRQVGRPEGAYRLTGAGEHLFAKAYDQLAVAMIDAMESLHGAAAVRGLLAHIADAKVEALGPTVKGASLQDRLRVLKDVYQADDPFSRVIQTDGDPIIEERNCPFLSVALQRPALCSLTVSVMSRLLGYKVKREASFQAGDGCCRFRVQLDKPIDPEFRFELESA